MKKVQHENLVDIPEKVAKEYVGSNYSFPPDDINPTEKVKEWWCRAFTRAILNRHFSGSTVINFGYRQEMQNLRAYMNGNQSVDRYYPLLWGKKVAEDPDRLSARLGLFRCNWNILKIAPSMVEYVKAVLDETDYFPRATNLSPSVMSEIEEKRYKMMARGQIDPSIYASLEQMGMPIPQETIIKDPEEMDMLTEMGGLRPAQELVAETLANAILDQSWEVVHNLLCEDYICFEKAIVKDSLDFFSGRVYPEYVDAINFVGAIDNVSFGSDFAYAGQIKFMSIKEIRERMRVAGTYVEGVENGLAMSATFFAGNYQNRYANNTSAPEYIEAFGFNYDMFKVPVFDVEYKTIDVEKRELRQNKDGKWKYLRKGFDESGPNITAVSREVFYRALMIIGSDVMIDFGKATDQKRVGLTKVKSSYHMVAGSGQSIMQRARTILDDMAVDYFKYQHDKAVARPNQTAISESAVDGHTQDGKSIKPGEALELMLMNASVIWKDQTIIGNSIMNNAVPIKEIQGGMGSVLTEYNMKFQIGINMLREVLNQKQVEIQPRVAVQVAQIGEQQTSRGINGVINSMRKLKEDFMDGAYQRVKLAIKHNKDVYNGYYPILGSSGIDTIKITADISNTDIGFKFIAKPTQFEVQDELNRLTQLATPRSGGAPAIQASTYYLIRNAILNGQINLARAYMIKVENKRVEIEQKMTEIAAQMQEQAQVRAMQLSSQIEMAKLEKEAELEVYVYQSKKMIDAKFGGLKNQNQ